MGAALAQVMPLVAEPPDGLVTLLADGAVRSGRDINPASDVPDTNLLPVLPALRELLPFGALQRGSVVTAGDWSMLCLALAAGPVAAGAWCAAVGIGEFGVVAGADAGLDPARLLLVPDLGPNWPQVVASLLDGCDLVLLRPPSRPSAQTRRKLEAAVRRYGAVLLVAGAWEGAQVRLRVTNQAWAGVGMGHGRLRGRKVQVVADGRGEWSRAQTRWLWLPGPDGMVAEADPPAMPEPLRSVGPLKPLKPPTPTPISAPTQAHEIELSENELSEMRFSRNGFSEIAPSEVESAGTEIGLAGTGIGLPGTGIGLPGTGIGLPGTGIGLAGTGIGLAGTGIELPGTGIGLPGTGIGFADTDEFASADEVVVDALGVG